MPIFLLRGVYLQMKIVQKIFIFTIILLGILSAAVIKVLYDENTILNQRITNIITEKNKIITDLNDTIKELDIQIQNVSNTNKSYVDELTELRTRSELYDKYSYAIINEMEERTELTYEEIKLGEQLMREKGYDPHLMFGTIMVESGGDPDAINESSGATGYGQFLNSTAEFVWSKLLGKGNYDPEVMKDGVSNIQMMAEYYDYLYSTKGDTFSVIKQYSGNATDEGAMNYLAKINSFTQKVGVVIQ